MFIFIQQIYDNLHQQIFVSDYKFVMFGFWIMTNVAYVTVQYHHFVESRHEL